MVELNFSAKKQNVRVLSEVYKRKDCEKLALKSKDKAFSLVHSVKTFFKKDSGKVKLVGCWKRFEPLWHISAESYMEYKRKTDYLFNVKPEVRSVKIGVKSIPVLDGEPVCRFIGEDHCVEKYSKEITVNAVDGKSKVDKYLEFESKPVKLIKNLEGRHSIVIPAKIRASSLVRELFKELIKPIHADRIIEEIIKINKLILYYRSVYSFEFVNTSTQQTGVVEVDSMTGAVCRGEKIGVVHGEFISKDVLFDISAELASNIIPGAGVGAFIGREIKRKRDKGKALKQMVRSKNALADKKKKLKKK